MKFVPPSRESASVKKYSRSKVGKTGVREDLQLNFFFLIFLPNFTSPLHNPINATHIRDSWSWLEECDLRIAFWAVDRKLWIITVWIHHRSREFERFVGSRETLTDIFFHKKKGKRHSLTNAQLIRPTLPSIKVHILSLTHSSSSSSSSPPTLTSSSPTRSSLSSTHLL